MYGLVRDVRYALRQLIRAPGFTLTAAVSLALGIGATTAVFSVIYAALISPFPYRGADRLVRLVIRHKTGRGQVPLNGPEILEVRKLSAVESVLAVDYHPMILTGQDLPANVNVLGLISTGFTDLGVPPLLGRGIAPSDAVYGREPQPVALLSYEFWQKQFLSDPSMVSKALELDHKKYTIIGVGAPRFHWYRGDIYIPLKLTPDPTVVYTVNLRLKPGVSFAVADAQLQPLLRQFAKATPRRFPDEPFQVQVDGINSATVSVIGGTLYLLFAAVGLLLAIACGNVSILLLARGTARQYELAVRAALGANRGRIVRQLLTEAMLLAGVGVALGVGMSYAILAIIRVFLPKYALRPESVIAINLPVLLFSAAVALATGVLFGLWPSLQLSRTRQAVQSGARRVAGSVHGRRSHNTLIVFQIALTLVLLAGAASSMQGFLRLMHASLGYDPHNVVSLGIPLRENSYTSWAARAAYFEQLRAKVAETPGVTMAAISSNATPPQNGSDYKLEILGKPAGGAHRARFNVVGPSYVPLLHIPLLQGRIWNDTENAAAAHIAVINHTLAHRYFPDGDAIGHSIKLPGIGSGTSAVVSAPRVAESWLQIVGIVGDARNDGLDKPVQPAVFVPYTCTMWRGTQILARTAVPPLTILHALRAQVAAVNPDQQIYQDSNDLEDWISEEPEWQQERLTTWVFGIFAVLAMLLASVGLFSVVSYTVAQRANEFGIRTALGARPKDVIGIVIASTAASVGTGMAAGLLLTLGLDRVMGQWIRGNPRDPLILLAGVALLALVSAGACGWPAWRAAKADPMEALRCP